MKTSKKKKIIIIITTNKQIRFKPTFDKIKQFEQLFQFPIDTVETIASNCHWVHRQINNITKALDSCIGK